MSVNRIFVMATSPNAYTPASPAALRHRVVRRHGFSLLESVIAMMVTVLVGAAAIGTLLRSQASASRNRLITNARIIVQRNIDTALGVPFTSVAIPTLLTVTNNSGDRYNDRPGAAQTDSIPVSITGEGDTVVEGRLTRIVTDLPKEQKPVDVSSSVMRRITFRIEYTYLGRPYWFEMSTIRAQDDQSM